ncbi:hypothetical protein [Enterococcus sp. DIV0756]|uniref:hypothetical protein n=1 Tax=Enterococcus sp. DIV0756 TaxID=2774636 RepID=UPI003F257113
MEARLAIKGIFYEFVDEVSWGFDDQLLWSSAKMCSLNHPNTILILKKIDNRYIKYTLIGIGVIELQYRLINRIKNTEILICIENG